MNDVSKNDGRTILFVSHNMAAVKELCSRSLLLKNGIISCSGGTNDVLAEYMATPVNLNATDLLADYKIRRGNGEVRFNKIIINNGDSVIDPSEETRMKFSGIVLKDVPCILFSLNVLGSSDFASITTISLYPIFNFPVASGTKFGFELIIPKNAFRTGLFPLYLWLGKRGELASDNYPYDVVDGLYFLNYKSQKDKNELGYNPIQPNGFFNISYKIESQTFN